jgi:ribosomal protein L3
MVSLLPKDELANLAESLVALTSLHRKVSRDLETVGGPIDVAIISKGDGFIWVKRKHYFRPELNAHFQLNYLREIGGKK